MSPKIPSLSVVLIVNGLNASAMRVSIKSIESQSRQPLERVIVFDSSESVYLKDWTCLNGNWNEWASCVNFAISKTKADFIALIEAGSSPTNDFVMNALKAVRENHSAPVIELGDIQIWNTQTIIDTGCWRGGKSDMMARFSKLKLNPVKISEGVVNLVHDVIVQNVSRPTHSVVITNFRRPQMLMEAFESCLAADVRNLVISSSGTDSEVKKVHELILRKKPDTRITSEECDSGCNENWIKGIESAGSEFVTLLHDDDKLNPSFRQVQNAMSDDVGIVVWDGSKHGSGSENDGFYEYLPFLSGGIHDSKMVYETLLKHNNLTLSPVGGAFRKDMLLRALIEARDNFKSKDFFIRNSMMVGNDLLLWLRCVQQSSKIRYIKHEMVSYGHHDGSVSYDDSVNQRGRLRPIYDKVRDYFLSDFPNIYHVVPRYQPSDIPTRKRIGRAEFTWNNLYDFKMIHPVHVWEKDYPRNSKSIGDRRGTPFLKDMLQAGIDAAGSNDYVMLTNDDTMVHPLAKWAIYSMMAKEEVCCAFRVSFDKNRMPTLFENPATIGKTGFFDKGRDLFVFSKDWLVRHMAQIPDYVLGSTDWDSTLGIAFRKWRDIPVTVNDYCLVHPRCELPLGYIYHENHTAFWSATQKRREVVGGNIHNRKLSMEFIKQNGVGWVI